MKPKILIACPTGKGSIFVDRALAMHTMLQEHAETILLSSGLGPWPCEGLDGAIVHNYVTDGTPTDVSLLAELMSMGVPSIYCLDPGPIHEERTRYTPEGHRFADDHSLGLDWIRDRRRKMELATMVHVDTMEQATIAERFYGVQPWWIASKAPSNWFPEIPANHELKPIKRLVCIGEIDGFDASKFCVANSLKYEPHDENDEARVAYTIRHVRDDAAVFWAKRSYHGERILDVAALGVPMAALSCGTLFPAEEAEWFESGIDAGDAIKRALAWNQDRIDEQQRAATRRTPSGYVEPMIEALLSCKRKDPET